MVHIAASIKGIFLECKSAKGIGMADERDESFVAIESINSSSDCNIEQLSGSGQERKRAGVTYSECSYVTSREHSA